MDVFSESLHGIDPDFSSAHQRFKVKEFQIPLLKDVFELMQEWFQVFNTGKTGLVDFAKVFERRRFAVVHHLRVTDVKNHEIFNEVVFQFMTLLSPKRRVPDVDQQRTATTAYAQRLGVLYALYMLFITQPPTHPPFAIRVPFDVIQNLTVLAGHDAVFQQQFDPSAVLASLIEAGAFFIIPSEFCNPVAPDVDIAVSPFDQRLNRIQTLPLDKIKALGDDIKSFVRKLDELKKKESRFSFVTEHHGEDLVKLALDQEQEVTRTYSERARSRYEDYAGPFNGTNTAGRNAAPPSLEEALDKAKLITRPPQPPTANDLIEAGIKPELYEKPPLIPFGTREHFRKLINNNPKPEHSDSATPKKKRKRRHIKGNSKNDDISEEAEVMYGTNTLSELQVPPLDPSVWKDLEDQITQSVLPPPLTEVEPSEPSVPSLASLPEV